MCYHNYTTHYGCSHTGEVSGLSIPKYELCKIACAKLSALRGPNSPPILPPSMNLPQPPKRSSTFLSKRVRSLGLSRSSTTTSIPASNDRRAISGPPANPPRGSASSSLDSPVPGMSDGEWKAVKCEVLMRRTRISREQDVCPECKKWIGEMRFMIQQYERNGSVKGTRAFEEFLRGREGPAALKGEVEMEERERREEEVGGLVGRRDELASF